MHRRVFRGPRATSNPAVHLQDRGERPRLTREILKLSSRSSDLFRDLVQFCASGSRITRGMSRSVLRWYAA